MSQVSREVKLTWKDIEYTVTPTNKLLRTIEREGISIPAMMVDFAEGRPVWSCFAFAAAELLKAGGAKVSEDDIMEEIFAAEEAGEVQALFAFAEGVISALVPQVRSPKKDKAAKRKK